MSKQLMTKVLLEGFKGPVQMFMSDFQDSLEARNYNGCILEAVSKQVPGYVKQFRPTTSDGYSWFWGHKFNTKSGVVAILIPWSQDWDKKDGSQCDRSPAAYTQGRVSEDEVVKILQQFSEAFAKHK